ncbi:hypothetical protein [Pseudomonas sp. St29]|uniref:hypothetical protein n=1 Tax=Pseudomonas sp. St29 TaxID=1500687 RepID=UPI0011DF803D|nr:hypothetical protein [Pseudomonas sp. St29]
MDDIDVAPIKGWRPGLRCWASGTDARRLARKIGGVYRQGAFADGPGESAQDLGHRRAADTQGFACTGGIAAGAEKLSACIAEEVSISVNLFSTQLSAETITSDPAIRPLIVFVLEAFKHKIEGQEAN